MEEIGRYQLGVNLQVANNDRSRSLSRVRLKAANTKLLECRTFVVILSSLPVDIGAGLERSRNYWY